MYPNSPTFDPGLLWLEDDPEPDPIDSEILTATTDYGWWSGRAGDEE